MMQYPVQHSSILMWHIIYLYTYSIAYSITLSLYIYYIISTDILLDILYCVYLSIFLINVRIQLFPVRQAWAWSQRCKAGWRSIPWCSTWICRASACATGGSGKKKRGFFWNICAPGDIYIYVYIYMYHTIWCITIWYYLSLYIYDTRLGPMAIRILHIYGTRRRMARERRGAESSSAVSMATLYYKTIY